MPRTVDVTRLAGVTEVCENVGVTRRGLKNWRDRNGFPPPVAELASGPVWDMRDVEKWVDERRAPRPLAAAARRSRDRAGVASPE